MVSPRSKSIENLIDAMELTCSDSMAALLQNVASTPTASNIEEEAVVAPPKPLPVKPKAKLPIPKVAMAKALTGGTSTSSMVDEQHEHEQHGHNSAPPGAKRCFRSRSPRRSL